MIIDEDNNNVFIFNKLISLKESLNKEDLDLKKIQKDIKQLDEFDNTQNYEYLNNLLDPIKAKGVKIPSNKPIPSCSFQMHNYITFKTMTNGNDIFTFNPFFLASEALINKPFVYNGTNKYLSTGAGTYFFNNPSTPPDGMSPATNWYFPDYTFQMIPDVYSKYRLVSACVTLRYTGPLDEASGVMGCGISYLNSPYVGTRYKDYPEQVGNAATRNPILDNYGNFELIRDSYYYSENLCIEGLKMLYFPLDNSFEEFKDVWDGTVEKVDSFQIDGILRLGLRISNKYFKPGFNWFIYVQNAPYVADSRNFRFDYYLNYECIPKAEFLNYMPVSISIYRISDEMKQKFIEEVKDRAIQKLNN